MNKTDTISGLVSNGTVTASTSNGVHIVEVWSVLVVQTTVCLIGAGLNIVNVIVFSQRQFSATPYLFMTALAVADAGTLLVHLPYGILRCDKRIHICTLSVLKWLRPYLSYYVTYIGFELGNMLEALSAWITVLISTERYVTMRWPHLSKLKFSRQQGKHQIVWIALIAVLFHLPLFFVLEVRHVTRSVNSNQTRHFQTTVLTTFGSSIYYYSYTWVRFIIVQLIPLVTLCFMNSLLLVVIWSSYRQQRQYQKKQFKTQHKQTDAMLSSMIEHRIEVERQSTLVAPTNGSQEGHNRCSKGRYSSVDFCPSDNGMLSQQIRGAGTKPVGSIPRLERCQQANNKLSILLVTIIFLFLIGQIPQAFAYVHILELITRRLCNSCPEYISLYRHFSQLLCLTTSAVHIFLYTALNRHFRQSLRNLICCCR